MDNGKKNYLSRLTSLTHTQYKVEPQRNLLVIFHPPRKNKAQETTIYNLLEENEAPWRLLHYFQYKKTHYCNSKTSIL